MKKLIASILTVLTVGASAQLTYVTTLDYDVDAPMALEINGNNFIDNDKYLISNINNKSSVVPEFYEILNSDFSLYKRVTIDTVGWSALGITDFSIFFSDHLYNSDDKVEIIYTFYNSFWDSDAQQSIITNAKTENWVCIICI